MTYTFKLARRLAVLRDFVMFVALALIVAGCTGDSTAPEFSPSSNDAPTAVAGILPRSVTIEINQPVRFRTSEISTEPSTLSLDGQRARNLIQRSTSVVWQSSGGAITADGTFSSATSGTFKVVGRGRGWKS